MVSFPPRMQSSVHQAANKHNYLISALAELDHAPASLSQTSSYIADVEQDLKNSEKRLKKLEVKTGHEREEHESIRDSVARRLAYKLTGQREKFEEKAKKEEREYVEALEEEVGMRTRRDTCQTSLKEAREKRAQLETQVAEYTSLQKQLDELYELIFCGPTPNFPEEDTAEQAYGQALASYNQTRALLDKEKQAGEILANANRSLEQARQGLDQALDASELDVWGVGGSMMDMMERSSLGQAQSHMSNAQMLLAQAQQVQPEIQSMDQVTIPQGNFMSDVLFDNIFSDIAFHGKIQATFDKVQAVLEQTRAQLKKLNERVVELERQTQEAADQLNGARRELQSARHSTFERILKDAPQPASEVEIRFPIPFE